jgi:cell division protein FtsN
VARAPLPHLAALICGVLAALAVGCGDRSNLIPSSRADQLNQQLADIKASVDQGRCDGLEDRVKAFHDDATSLSSSVDARLRRRINEGVKALEDTAVGDCEQVARAQTQPTETTDTTTTETTTTDTEPSQAQPETTSVPSDTTTTETTPLTPTTTTPTTPGDDGTGGTGPGDGTGGTDTGASGTPDTGGLTPEEQVTP